MEAYQSFCQHQLGEVVSIQHLAIEGATQTKELTPKQQLRAAIIKQLSMRGELEPDEDSFNFPAWCKSYKDSYRSEWWTLKPGEEINEMLRDLPLTDMAWQEVSSMVLAVQRSSQ
jgi:hypothetical protein